MITVQRSQPAQTLAVAGFEIGYVRRSGITDPASPVSVFVIPTDEERVMVEDTVALVKGRHAGTRLRYSFEDPTFVDEERYAGLQAEIAKTPALAEIVVSGQRS